MSIARIRTVKYRHKIDPPSGTVLIQNGVILEPTWVTAPNGLVSSIAYGGDTSGGSDSKNIVLNDKLLGRQLRATVVYQRTNRCFNGQITWYGYFNCNSVAVSSFGFIDNDNATKTDDITPSSVTLTIGNVLNRTANPTQHTQADASKVTLKDLVVL